jgi:hypothetical protein
VLRRGPVSPGPRCGTMPSMSTVSYFLIFQLFLLPETYYCPKPRLRFRMLILAVLDKFSSVQNVTLPSKACPVYPLGGHTSQIVFRSRASTTPLDSLLSRTIRFQLATVLRMFMSLSLSLSLSHSFVLQPRRDFAGSEFLCVDATKNTASLNMTPCSLVKVCVTVEGTSCPYLQRQSGGQAKKQQSLSCCLIVAGCLL